MHLKPFCIGFFNSGLLIASKYPILTTEFHIFPELSGPYQSLASKGFLIAAILINGRLVIVINSHLDAMFSDDDAAKQLKTCKRRVDQIIYIRKILDQFLRG